MKSFWLGMVSAAAVLAGLLRLLSGAPSNAPFLETFHPIKAIEGLAFALGFGAGFPSTLAVITAAGVLIGAPVATFWVVRRLSRRLDRPATD